MKQRWSMLVVLMCLAQGICHAEEPSRAAVATFNTYVGALEARLAGQHRQGGGIDLAGGPARQDARIRRGELVVENLTPTTDHLPGALLHHWRGTAFVPGATAAEFESIMRDFAAYPRIYTPQVLSAQVLAQHGDRYQVKMRVEQKHVLTVVLDTNYDVEFGQLDARHVWSISRSTHIGEIDDAGTKNERELSPADQNGFLWRLNTYWTCEEQDGGLYMQIESVSLTRSIPRGLGWMVGPFVESVPQDSLEFTLRATRGVLRR